MNHATDIEAHRAWMALIKTTDNATDAGVCPCEVCGCLGNASCGHDPLDSERCCTLDAVQTCPCCAEVARVAKGATA